MEQYLREFTTSPLPLTTINDEIERSSRTANYKRESTTIKPKKQQLTEEERRFFFEKDISDAHEKGLWVCRLWQLLLTLNVTVIFTTMALILLLLFIIGPLSPYQTYGQSCRALSCNSGQGLVCNTKSICVCPSINSYWSYNETGCRRCSNGWSMVNGKCLFISTFSLNWTESFSYCKSFTAQLLTLSSAKLYPNFTLSYVSNITSLNTNYFIGLSEQPNDSGNWQWVDGSRLLSSSMNLFCTNGTINQFDPVFRTSMSCGIYRMDSCLARYACQRVDINFICEKSRKFIK